MTRASDLARLIGAGATINDGTTITTDDNTTQLTLKSTDTDSGVGPIISLSRDNDSAADDDLIGQIHFFAEHDGNSQHKYSEIFCQIADASDGSEDGRLYFNVSDGGSNREFMRMTGSEGIVINEEGEADLDFRVESNNNANMLVVDGGNDNVGIGGTGNPTLYVVNNSAGPGLTAANATAVFHGSVDIGKGGCIGFDFGASHTNYPVGMGYLITSQSASTKGDLGFFTRNGTGDDAPTQRFRIQADGRLVQTSQGTTTGGVNLLGESGSSSKAVVFAHVGNGSEVGSITTASSSTAYNTSSDYRLKDNINYDWDGTTEIKKLKPAKFNFKIDADTTVHGFIAHEVSDIVPEAVTGTKDGVEVWEKGDDLPKDDKGKLTASVGDNKLDADGKTIPKYQGIDQSKLVPLLTKTLQEALTRIDTLETENKTQATQIADLISRVTALESK